MKKDVVIFGRILHAFCSVFVSKTHPQHFSHNFPGAIRQPFRPLAPISTTYFFSHDSSASLAQVTFWLKAVAFFLSFGHARASAEPILGTIFRAGRARMASLWHLLDDVLRSRGLLLAKIGSSAPTPSRPFRKRRRGLAEASLTRQGDVAEKRSPRTSTGKLT